MKSFGTKHPLSDDDIHILLSGEKVRVMGKSENQYSGLPHEAKYDALVTAKVLENLIKQNWSDMWFEHS